MKNWTETKEERKLRKACEKAGLSNIVETTAQPVQISQDKKYIICLKWGSKYGPEYVNKLYNMVKRNCTINYEFICFTEDTTGIDKHVRCEPLPKMSVSGWWFKPWFLSNELPINGTALYFDLDVIVFRNIDQFFSYKPENDFVIIRDFNRSLRRSWDKMNSSVFRFTIGHYQDKFLQFKTDTASNVRRFQGDQDWMYQNIRNHVFWPDEWIQSYKWEMRGRDHLTVVNGRRNFKTNGQPKILNNTSVAVFHGEPNIHDCIDSWPRDNWY
tara:strand:- start:202 stop:1011 length:810 start_codon:yes stop_codon:yes gene_type:complete